MKSSPRCSAIDAFLHGLIDYAGLFPPARLPLQTALENFSFYQRHPRSAMLARFVLPLDSLNAHPLPSRITLVCRGENVALHALPSQVEAVEVAGSLAAMPGCTVFQEIDWRADLESAMPAHGGVKLRTGGLTPDAIPPAAAVARFLLAAAKRRLPIKFTAGLHVPVPNDDPHVGARAHGFFNVFAAAFAAYSGETDIARLENLLESASWPDFRFEEDSFLAGPYKFSTEEIRELRKNWVISFGSCSFLEPVEHLESHGYLQPE